MDDCSRFALCLQACATATVQAHLIVRRMACPLACSWITTAPELVIRLGIGISHPHPQTLGKDERHPQNRLAQRTFRAANRL